MSSNLNYGQAIPGITEGRGIGIIDTHHLPYLIDAMGLLAGAKAWSLLQVLTHKNVELSFAGI